MNIIRNALVFSADLPDAKALAEAMEPLRYQPITEAQAQSLGFIETDATPGLVTSFEGGMTFTLRIDEKVLPRGPVDAEVNKEINAATVEAGHELDKGRIADIKEDVIARLVSTALTDTTMLRALYWPADKFLIVATSSKTNAERMMSMLVRACESVKTTTIHVDGIRFGLTAHLRNHLEGLPKDFGRFSIGDSVVLKSEGAKVVFDVGNLDHAREGLLEAIRGGMHVEKLELEHGTMSFMLNDQFRFSKVSFFGAEDEQEQPETLPEIWARTAHIEVSQFAAAMRELCSVFGRQTDIEIDGAEPGDGDKDDLYSAAVSFVQKTSRASISAIQRHLKIGYNRAARYIEKMEAEGIVTPVQDNGTRSVIEKE